MKRKTKIIISVGGALLLLVGLIGTHEYLLVNTKNRVKLTQTELRKSNLQLSQVQTTLEKFKSGGLSNIRGQFPETKFTDTQSIILPIPANYKINNSNVAKWVVKYINELRTINGIDSRVTWSETSPEQTFAHSFATGGNPKFEGKYDLIGYEIDPSADIAGRSESDQETAYQIVMTLYDQSGEPGYQANIKGDYASKANLLYDEPALGIETITGVALAIDHQQDPKYKAAYTTMYTTDKTPDTKPLPDISFHYLDLNTLKTQEEKVKIVQNKVDKDKKIFQKAQANLKQIQRNFL